MSYSLLRLAFVGEFLLAVIAAFTLWAQVGGQGHLDLMPWYWKLILGVGWSLAAVGLTAALCSQETLWNARVVRWVALILLFSVGMFAVTYYYHLNEPADTGEEDETSVASAVVSPLHRSA